MEIWQAIVLGMVQGFAEFLPISSSGHLMLLQHWFGIEEGAFFFSIMLHIGTLIPVCVVFFKQIIDVFKKPFDKFLFWVLASIPAGLIGLALSFVEVDEFFNDNLWLLGTTFLITAGVLIFTERRQKTVSMDNDINIKTALIMGAGQACGVLPGLSRSGSTITAGVIGKVNKEDNAFFTFLMSIPVIIAAALLEGIKGIVDSGLGDIEIVPVLIGMVTAMITGYIAIKFMLRVIKKANYKWFSLYLVLISIATFITYFVGL